ncbi:Abi family protein [Veillonella sp. VA139]|uniref:Abi family protein n=1 Tax=Veillonella sp. VA139 TaxID=741830 RepID=UPI000F8E284A|nr:Abi family protein [Veillonella sp. VA139]
MNTPKALSHDELLTLFSDKGMSVSEGDSFIFQHINYYKLKNIAKPLAINLGKGKLSYEGLKFKDIIKRYYQDKDLRIFLLHAIEEVEISIKANFANILGERYGAFGYLDFSTWCNKEKTTKEYICQQEFLVKEALLGSLKRMSYNLNSNQENFNEEGSPTVWIAFDLLTLGMIVKMLDMLSEKNLTRLASIYGCTNNELISWLKCIYFIRNICAHNGNLIDIKVRKKPKVRLPWYDNIVYHEIEGAKKATNRFAIVLLIIMELVRQINPTYDWGYLKQTINKICIDDKRAILMGFQSKEKVESLL